MSAHVVTFRRRAVPRDWSAQEVAEFYRVESALLRAGLRVSSDRGITDEGDPWFVFCRAEDDEVIAHFARIGGRYLISAPSYGSDVTGYDFCALVRGLVERHPVLQTERRGDNVAFHPSALLIVLVASALLKAGHAAEAASARAAEASSADADQVPLRVSAALPEHALDTASQEFQQNAVILSAIAFATAPLDAASVPTIVVTAPAPELPVADHAPAPLLALSLEPDPVVHVAGTGSLTPSPTHLPSLAPLPLGDATLAHDAAAWQLQAAPLTGTGSASTDSGAAVANPPPPPWPYPLEQSIPGTAGGPPMHVAGLSAVQDLAVTVLHVLGGNEPLVYQDALPAAFIAPLHDSVHATHAVAAESESSTQAATAVDSAAVHAGSAPVAGGTASAAPAQTPAALAPELSLADLNAVLANMQAFTKEVGSHLAVLVTSTQVIAYDAYAVDHTPAAVTAVTYDFVDGSSISLVGLPAELPHALV